MDREGPLDAHSEADLAHTEGLPRSGSLAPDDRSLEDLHALPVSFDDPHVHAQGVAGSEGRHVIAKSGAVNKIGRVHRGLLRWLSDR